ncbi:MAG: helix-hairpin-helix domain-containing protein [Flammeovirgaceae bacterium]|nr:helix-hairpin-helix domain-containing protein [Flammeovirgaceae bacterium]
MLGYLKKWIRNTLGFSRTETNGFLILLPLVIVFILAVPVYQWWRGTRPVDYTYERELLDSLTSSWTYTTKDSTVLEPTLFSFDPNTASLDDLLTLGFPGNIAQRIVNYRSKGGKFLNSNDLKRIYGIDSAHVNILLPYIRIASKEVAAKNEIPQRTKEAKTTERFDINTADTIQLKKVYGIGSVLATRIVKYRDKLGGFVEINQLYEVYGLDSLVVSRAEEMFYVVDNSMVHKLNLNTADEKELSDHPYITYQMARSILTFRFQHGKFSSIDDLTQIKTITPTQLAKIKPYLTL